MAIAHEIAVNSDFKLEKLQFPENRLLTALSTNPYSGILTTMFVFSLGKRVKDVVHQAFWDLLAENLKQTPPNFEQALSLLTDIKIVSY